MGKSTNVTATGRNDILLTEEAYLADVRRRQERVWPADAHKGVIYPFGEIPISDYLRKWAQRAPDRVAFSFYGRNLTFGKLDELSDRFAGWLDSIGAKPGDRVGVLLPNCPQFVIAFYGILKFGAVHVPVNPQLRERELTYQLADAEVSALVALNTLAADIEKIRAHTPLGHVLFTAFDDYLPEAPSLPLPEIQSHASSANVPPSQWGLVLSAPRSSTSNGSLDALAVLNYTGGTMGMPKGCQHTQRHMLYTAATTAGAWKLGSPFGGQDEDVSLVFVPIFWIGGEDLALLVPMVSGTACVLMARWDPLAILTAVERFRVTHLVAAVDSYVEIMELPTLRRFDLSSLRLTLAASLIRKLDVGVRRAWREYAGTNSVLREGAFGMTETHSMDTSTAGLEGADADLNTRPVFCGLPVPGTEIKVVEFGSGKVIPLGEEGEIAVRSPSVFTGYWRAPEATATALRDGWLYTGDVGIIDESGCLHFLGRKKEMIKVKGMSVFPTEIESLMRTHPAVTAVAVVPKDDEIRGQVPVAFIELAPNTNCTAEELSAWAQENMARYKVPQIRLIEAIPRTATGKMKKGELLDRV